MPDPQDKLFIKLEKLYGWVMFHGQKRSRMMNCVAQDFVFVFLMNTLQMAGKEKALLKLMGDINTTKYKCHFHCKFFLL